jgi:hypothetical protein
MEKAFVVKQVAEKLWAAEGAIDETLAQTSALMSGIVQARQEINVSHIVIDPAVGKVAEAMSALAQARAAMIEAHHALYEAKLRIGVRTKLIGYTPSVEEDHVEVRPSEQRRAG